MKWIHENQCNGDRCERVPITRHEERGFVEYPDDVALATFDRSDRKFVAVALKSELDPTILNAVDADWSEHQDAFQACGVVVKELCPGCLKGACEDHESRDV